MTTIVKTVFQTVLIASFAVWFGGFTFYVSFVVPIGGSTFQWVFAWMWLFVVLQNWFNESRARNKAPAQRPVQS